MEGILKRVSASTDPAANALRIVNFFDSLVQNRADMDALVRATATLMDVTAGYQSETHSVAFNQHGQSLGATPPDAALTRELTGSPAETGTVWLLPPSDYSELAPLAVERMAIAAAVVLVRRAEAARVADMEPLREVLRPDSTPMGRSRALRALGFDPSWRVRVVIASGQSPVLLESSWWRNWLGPATDRVSAPLRTPEGGHVVLTRASKEGPPQAPTEVETCSVGTTVAATQARDSLLSAQITLRFCSKRIGPRMLSADQIGPLTLLAALPVTAIRESELVARLIELEQSSGGSEDVLVLDAYCRHGNLRAAATELFLHHGSVARRLKNIGSRLNVDLADAEQRNLIWLGLQLLRVCESG